MVGPMAGPSALEFDQGNAWVLGTPGGGATLDTSAKMI